MVHLADTQITDVGLEHLEGVRPAIFTFNHQSYLDSVVMAHLVRHDFVALCKQEVAENRLLGPLLRTLPRGDGHTIMTIPGPPP